MTFSIKDGARVDRMHPAMVAAWPTIMQVFARHGYSTTLTEGNDTIGRKNTSFHKLIPCRACDWRTWENSRGEQIDDGVRAAITIDLRRELGPDFDVVSKPTHIHTEYDPR